MAEQSRRAPVGASSAISIGAADGPSPGVAGIAVELNGINVIAEHERKGAPRDLFWPWCAANIAVLGISDGAWVLGTGISFWQAVLASALGIVLSFLLVGLTSLSGKRASVPTMIVSRAAFGVRGGGLPAAVCYLSLVGWEIVLCATATLATATMFERLGWGSDDFAKVAAFVVVAVLIVAASMYGFDVIMRLQSVLTVAIAVLTVGYMLLTADRIRFGVLAGLPPGSLQSFLGATVFAFIVFGLGWVNTGGDYSRYLPRATSGAGVVGWTTAGAGAAPAVLVVYGLLLAGSNPALGKQINADPLGALTGLLPTWYLVPFMLVVIGGTVGGAVLAIYSSGLTLLTLGLRVPRWTAAGLDGVLTVLGTIYVVWVAQDFFGPFSGFLNTLGVPIAAWCGVFLADLSLRRRDYAEADLFDPAGRYGSLRLPATGVLVLASVIGWGLVTNSYADWLSWQGYLLGPIGLGGRAGAWASANPGVPVAVLVGFVGYRLTGAAAVRRQEAAPDAR
jgi:nucleobase:cation symporter-1, NCS1 family